MSPVTRKEHAESWTVTVVPGDGDEPWPLVTAPDGMQLEPDLILVWFQTGNEPVVKGSGRRVRRDSTVGSLRVNAPWSVLDDLPDWARKLADAAVAEHGLAGQLPGHEIVPLPGSVQARNRLRLQDGALPEETRLYPLTALCSVCQEPAVLSTPDSAWGHSTDAGQER